MVILYVLVGIFFGFFSVIYWDQVEKWFQENIHSFHLARWKEEKKKVRLSDAQAELFEEVHGVQPEFIWEYYRVCSVCGKRERLWNKGRMYQY